MRNSFVFVLAIFLVINVNAQNVGQEGDTLLNYTDINGFKQGYWTKKYNNDAIKYKAYFVNDKPVGELKRYSPSGVMTAHLIYDSVGEYATAKIYHNSKEIAGEGEYFEKLKHGVWKYYDSRGTIYLQESFNKGVKHGQFLQITSEGVVIEEVNWVDGVKHGAWIKRYAEGPKMFEATYVNGKLEGITKTYYKSGVLHKEGKFVNDLMHGPWKYYSESGNLQKVYQFKDGHSDAAERDQNEFLEELEKNKGSFDGPKNGNDLDWLRGNRY